MSRTNFEQLLEAGCHFGHLKRKWNPAMAPYIFMERNGIHIIDLNKTVDHIEVAADALKQIAKSGKRILFVATKKQAKDIVRNISVDNNSTILNRNISRIDEVEIISVPSDLMKTVYDFTNGWAVGATAKQINMLLIHPVAVLTPVSYSFASMETPSAHSKGKYLYYEESFEDVFILNQRKNAIKFNVEA